MIKKVLGRLRDTDDFCMKPEDEVEIVRAEGGSERSAEWFEQR